MKPTAPPSAACGSKALQIINEIASGTFSIFKRIITSEVVTYKIAINGTITDDAVAIRFTPPRMIKPTKSVTIIAVTKTGILKVSCIAWVIALTCGNVPIPKKATITPNNANNFASHLIPRPRSM